MSERSAVVLLQLQLLGPRNQAALTWKADVGCGKREIIGTQIWLV